MDKLNQIFKDQQEALLQERQMFQAFASTPAGQSLQRRLEKEIRRVMNCVPTSDGIAQALMLGEEQGRRKLALEILLLMEPMKEKK
jgi:hypothetical protein